MKRKILKLTGQKERERESGTKQRNEKEVEGEKERRGKEGRNSCEQTTTEIGTVGKQFLRKELKMEKKGLEPAGGPDYFDRT